MTLIQLGEAYKNAGDVESAEKYITKAHNLHINMYEETSVQSNSHNIEHSNSHIYLVKTVAISLHELGTIQLQKGSFN